MGERIFINGKKANDKPTRSLFYGEGLFETFRWNKKKPEYISEHIRRLRDGSRFFQIPFPAEKYIIEKIGEAIAGSGGLLEDLYVKVALISKGDCVFFKNPSGSSLLVMTKPYIEASNNVSVYIASQRRNQKSVLLKHKTFNYLENIISRREAMEKGFDDAIFLNTSDDLTEATSSNLFWVKGMSLFTPSVESGILPGITREITLNVAKTLGYKTYCGRFVLSSLLDSNFAFLTNSLRGASFISKIGEKIMSSRSDSYTEIKNTLFRSLKWDNF